MRSSELFKRFFQIVDIVFAMTKSTMKSRYRKTFAGFLWVILNPVLTFAVQAIIFKHILRVDVENYYLFLMSGIVPWIFVTSTMNMTVSAFVVNRPVLMAFKLDPWIFILSQSIDNLITFIFSFIVLLVFNFDHSVFMNLKIPMFIFATMLICISAFFMSFFLAILHVFVRDTQFVLQFVLNLAYFVTPIFYPKEFIPQKYQWLIDYNPLYILIRPFQNIFWHYEPTFFFVNSFKAIALTIVLIGGCLFYWRKKRNEIYFRI